MSAFDNALFKGNEVMKYRSVSRLFVLLMLGASIVPAYAASSIAAFSQMYLSPYEEGLATAAGIVEHGVPMADVCKGIEYGQAMGLFWKVQKCETKIGQVISTDDIDGDYIAELALRVRYTQITTENLDGEPVHLLSAQTMPSTRFETYPVHGRTSGYDRNNTYIRGYFEDAGIRMCLLEGANRDCDDTDDNDIYGMSADKEVTTEAISGDAALAGATDRRLAHTYRMTADGRILVVTESALEPSDEVQALLYRETPGYYSEVHENANGLSYTMRYRTLGASNRELASDAIHKASSGNMPDEANGGRLDMTTLWRVDPDRIGSRNLRMAVEVRAHAAKLNTVSNWKVRLSGDVVRSSAAFDIEPDY